MFSCLVSEKLFPDFSHLILGSGKPEASQLKNRGVDALTVIFCGTSINWTGTRQEERNNKIFPSLPLECNLVKKHPLHMLQKLDYKMWYIHLKKKN